MFSFIAKGFDFLWEVKQYWVEAGAPDFLQLETQAAEVTKSWLTF